MVSGGQSVHGEARKHAIGVRSLGHVSEECDGGDAQIMIMIRYRSCYNAWKASNEVVKVVTCRKEDAQRVRMRDERERIEIVTTAELMKFASAETHCLHASP